VIPSKKTLSKDASKRLDAIANLEDLGVGFTLASHDLEIRGAGELLGDEQSGHIQQIGYSLYNELLERAVSDLKQGKQPQLDRPLDHGTEINLQIPALLPEDYIYDVHSRLMMYKRIASATDSTALQELQIELIDRFGLLPDMAKNLFAITEIKLTATPLGIQKIELGTDGGHITFTEKPPIDPMKIIHLIQTQYSVYQFKGADTLQITKTLPKAEDRFLFLDGFFAKLR